MKKYYKSKMLWAAVLTGIIGVATVVVSEELVSSNTAGSVIIAIGVMNSVLRVLTTQGLKL